MASLSPINVDALESGFRAFLPNVTIFSKDLGRTNINLFDAQDYFLDELFAGLRQDIHWFVTAKGRQLGLTTICLLLDCFWCGTVPDVQGAVVFDTQQNKDKFRILLQDMLKNLPPAFRLPTSKFDRDFITFKNGNMLDFLTAGIKKGQGTLGRSRALNFVHGTEICSFGDPDAFEAFKDTLSDQFPARLYLFESTARGPNLFMDLWEEAGEDPITRKQIFIGWWRKETNRYRTNTRLFTRYGYPEKSKWELDSENEVKRVYGVEITLEQWAWFRHRLDPRASSEWSADDNSTRLEVVHEEHPTTPSDLFRQTGSSFIPGRMLKTAAEEAAKHPFKGYKYYIGEDLSAVRLEQLPAAFRNQIQLRIWQEPVPGGRYVLAADPAYASGDESDFFVISVFRVYADRCAQVAEFAERNMFEYQFAWVMAHLSNYYGLCRIILDVNGPGQAVLGEFRHLRQMLEGGALDVRKASDQITEQDLEQNRHFRSFFSGVRNYLYHRFDSFGGGYNLQWKGLALDELLPTPTGWTTMEDIREGDTLFDERGKPCRVSRVSPIHYDHVCYRVTFEDKMSIVTDWDHQWVLDTGETVQTIDLDKGGRIQVTQPLECSSSEFLPIGPYTLGYWLGNGDASGNRIHSHILDVNEVSHQINLEGYDLNPISVKPNSKGCYRSIKTLLEPLRELNLIGNKHIPPVYLRASIEQRWALLQGLMDSDGTVAYPGNQCSFTTVTPALVEGFAELIRSLGYKAKYFSRDRTSSSLKKPKLAYQFYFTAYSGDAVFRLPRKADRLQWEARWTLAMRSKCRKVLGIEECPSVPVRCVAVDSPSHLYLAGKAMIPTHNSTVELQASMWAQFRDQLLTGHLQIYSQECLAQIRRLVQEGMYITAEGRGKKDRAVAAAMANRCWIDMERRSLIEEGRTFDAENSNPQLTQVNTVGQYISMAFRDSVTSKEAQRQAANRMTSRPAWRAGVWRGRGRQ